MRQLFARQHLHTNTLYCINRIWISTFFAFHRVMKDRGPLVNFLMHKALFEYSFAYTLSISTR